MIDLKKLSTSELVEQWLREQDINPVSRSTYRMAFRCYQKWIVINSIPILQVQPEHIIDFKRFLIDNKGSRTADLYFTVVRRFYKWLELRKVYPNICFGIHSPRKEKSFSRMPLSVDQVQNLLKSINRDDLKGKRDFAMILLMVRTGLRAVEVSRMDVADITTMNGANVLKIQAKGRTHKGTIVPVSENTLKPIRDYLTDPMYYSEDALFTTTRHGKRMPPDYIGLVIKRRMKAAGLTEKGFSSHSLRHTTADLLLRDNESLFNVQQVLRHTNPGITSLYLRKLEMERMIQNPATKRLDDIIQID